MKNTARILLLTLLCTLACGCAKKAPNPLEDALGAHILQGREGTFRLYKIEKIDSTTFRTEFEHRQNVFQLKLQKESELYEEYSLQRKPKNAARHWEAIQRTYEVMKGLDSLESAMNGRMDEIAYYDYVFSGRAETDEAITEFQDTYVSLTPSLEVVSMTAKQKDLHKAGGRAIPGYMEMLGGTSEEEE